MLSAARLETTTLHGGHIRAAWGPRLLGGFASNLQAFLKKQLLEIGTDTTLMGRDLQISSRSTHPAPPNRAEEGQEPRHMRGLPLH